MIITTIGVSAATVSRINTQTTSRANNWLEAQVLAFTAIEHAATVLPTDPTWRTTYTHDVAVVTETYGHGTFTWKLVDTTDTNLADDTTDPALIVATGTVNDAVYKLSVQLTTDAGGGITYDAQSWQRVVD